MPSPYYGANQRPVIRRRARRAPPRARHINQQWKIAYADFATAMMAFFMLLWLMSHSEKVSLQGVADYFAPSNATMSNSSGAGSILAGAALGPDGAKSSGAYNPDMLAAIPAHRDALGYGTTQAKDKTSGANAAGASADTDANAERLQAAIMRAPDLAAMRAGDALRIAPTPAGARIDLSDTAERPLFAAGDGEPNAYGRRMIAALATELIGDRRRLAIAAHTDASGNRAGNWALSTARALAVRRIMVASGNGADRFAEIAGRADADPVYPLDPMRPENRRVTILMLDEVPAAPARLARPR
ncbi:MAG: flagellar motor protein MotB [Pseudomonadota bacterium]